MKASEKKDMESSGNQHNAASSGNVMHRPVLCFCIIRFSDKPSNSPSPAAFDLTYISLDLEVDLQCYSGFKDLGFFTFFSLSDLGFLVFGPFHFGWTVSGSWGRLRLNSLIFAALKMSGSSGSGCSDFVTVKPGGLSICFSEALERCHGDHVVVNLPTCFRFSLMNLKQWKNVFLLIHVLLLAEGEPNIKNRTEWNERELIHCGDARSLWRPPPWCLSLSSFSPPPVQRLWVGTDGGMDGGMDRGREERFQSHDARSHF